MSEKSPREQLEERVRARFSEMGYDGAWSRDMSLQAVAEFYNGDQSGTYFSLVAAESYQLIIEVIPPVANHVMQVFQGAKAAIDQLSLYVYMANKAKVEPPKLTPRYNASGLPIDDGPDEHAVVEHHVDPPVSANIDVADEVSLEDTGRPRCTHPSDQVIELTEREWHLACARRLKQLDCTYGELEQMASEGDFLTSQHHSAWFSFGGNIRLEQLDRANFVLDVLTRGDAFGIDMDDAAIARVEERYPTDRITGAPDHYVLNGDHSACGCGGHLLECTTWGNPLNSHAASICGIARTLCRHSPRHPYRELCSDDQPDGIGVDTLRVRAGFTVEGDPVYGPVADQ